MRARGSGSSAWALRALEAQAAKEGEEREGLEQELEGLAQELELKTAAADEK